MLMNFYQNPQLFKEKPLTCCHEMLISIAHTAKWSIRFFKFDEMNVENKQVSDIVEGKIRRSITYFPKMALI